MNDKSGNSDPQHNDFYQLVKKAYKKGMTEEDITLKRILEELKSDLNFMLIR